MRTHGLLGLAVVGLLAACSAGSNEGAVRGSRSGATQAAFDRHAVLDDRSLRDKDALTADDIQRFLDETPWGHASVLATYEEDGKSAAQIMHDAAVKHGINPLELIVRVQMEQGLISKKAASDEAITLAFGCGCPHSPVCSPKYEGFANQAECAAGTLARSMDRALTSQGTVSGWAKNRAKTTEDGLDVSPKNAATAALYTYTPWVGEAGGGKKGIGGVSLHFKVWNQFATAVSYGAWAPQNDAPIGGGERADAGAEGEGEGEGEPLPQPVEAGPEPEPEADAGAPEPEPEPEPEADAGPPPNDENTSDPEAEAEGKDDDAILGEGNAPPSSNGPPPKSSSSGRGRGDDSEDEDLPLASEEELAGKPKQQDGCSTTGGSGGSNAALVGLAVAAVLAGRRRRR